LKASEDSSRTQRQFKRTLEQMTPDLRSLPTEQEEREWKEEAVRAADARFQNGDPEIEDDDNFHDDTLSDEAEDAQEIAPPFMAEDVEDVEMAQEEQSVA
jgi:hypothetical protein